MSANIPRYLIENHGPDQEAIKTAFSGAFQVCVQNGITSITLLVPSKGTFHSTVVGSFLGDKITKALCKGETVKIAENLTMDLESPKTISTFKSYGMVIGIYLSKKDLNVLDSIISAQAMALLPWLEEEGKTWLSTWNATVLGKSTWQVQQTVFPQDVENDLLSLSQGINLSTGLLSAVLGTNDEFNQIVAWSRMRNALAHGNVQRYGGEYEHELPQMVTMIDHVKATFEAEYHYYGWRGSHFD